MEKKKPTTQKKSVTRRKPVQKRTAPKKIRIAILDDSDFFNRIVTHQLKSYTDGLALNDEREFEIESYSDARDFFRNLKEDVDLVYTDYYLGSGITGEDILKATRERCTDCTVVIISQNRNRQTAVDSISHGAEKFIYKDKHALPKTCFFLDDFLRQRYKA